MTILYQIESGHIHLDVALLGIKDMLNTLMPGDADDVY